MINTIMNKFEVNNMRKYRGISDKARLQYYKFCSPYHEVDFALATAKPCEENDSHSHSSGGK
jgi:hypothetical protein